MADGPVLHRPILGSGTVLGYLWCTAGSAGFWPRAGSGADDQVRAYWMRWLTSARESGLSPWEALSSWDPRLDFPHGTPAIGAPSELPGLDDLRALAEGRTPATTYADGTAAAVRHYQVVRGGTYLGRLWASVDDEAAGFLPSPDLAPDDPAARAWPRRLADSCTSGLTPGQALHALRQAPDDGTTGHLTDPPGQSHLHDLHR